jgi:hypothetical protein
MQDYRPLYCGEVDLATVEYAEPVTLRDRSPIKWVRMRYPGVSDDGMLVLQTPWLKTQKGVVCRPCVFGAQGQQIASLTVSLGNRHGGPNGGGTEVAAFERFLLQLDDSVVTYASSTACVEWFNVSSMSKSVCQVLYVPTVSSADDLADDVVDDAADAATFSMNVPLCGGRRCQLFDSGRREVTGDHGERMTGPGDVRAIICCESVWLAGGRLGVRWRALQLEYRQHAGSRFVELGLRQPCPTGECVVCLDAPSSTLFVPCGHRILCASCAARVQTCPICRAVIAHTVPTRMPYGARQAGAVRRYILYRVLTALHARDRPLAVIVAYLERLTTTAGHNTPALRLCVEDIIVCHNNWAHPI